MDQFSSLDLAMSFLRRTSEGEYIWCDNGLEAISVLLDAIFTLADPEPAVDELLRLAAALELELGSAKAGAELMVLLGGDLRVLELVDFREHSKTDLENWSGAAPIKRAPMQNQTPRVAVAPVDDKKRRQFRVTNPG